MHALPFLAISLLTCLASCGEAPSDLAPDDPGEPAGDPSAPSLSGGEAFPGWPLVAVGETDVVLGTEFPPTGDDAIDFFDRSESVAGEEGLASGTCSIQLSSDHALVAVGPVGYWFEHTTVYLELKGIEGKWSASRIGLWEHSDFGGGRWRTSLEGHVSVEGSGDQALVRCDLVLHDAKKRGVRARFTVELGQGSELLEGHLESYPHGQAMHLSRASQSSGDR